MSIDLVRTAQQAMAMRPAAFLRTKRGGAFIKARRQAVFLNLDMYFLKTGIPKTLYGALFSVLADSRGSSIRSPTWVPAAIVLTSGELVPWNISLTSL